MTHLTSPSHPQVFAVLRTQVVWLVHCFHTGAARSFDTEAATMESSPHVSLTFWVNVAALARRVECCRNMLGVGPVEEILTCCLLPILDHLRSGGVITAVDGLVLDKLVAWIHHSWVRAICCILRIRVIGLRVAIGSSSCALWYEWALEGNSINSASGVENHLHIFAAFYLHCHLLLNKRILYRWCGLAVEVVLSCAQSLFLDRNLPLVLRVHRKPIENLSWLVCLEVRGSGICWAINTAILSFGIVILSAVHQGIIHHRETVQLLPFNWPRLNFNSVDRGEARVRFNIGCRGLVDHLIAFLVQFDN